VLADERRIVHEAMLRDLVGFAGAEIIRRVIGFAHNLDFESITDAHRRAACERRALRLARRLLLEPAAFTDIEHISSAARAI
jgi:5-methylthioribose kinase